MFNEIARCTGVTDPGDPLAPQTAVRYQFDTPVGEIVWDVPWPIRSIVPGQRYAITCQFHDDSDAATAADQSLKRAYGVHLESVDGLDDYAAVIDHCEHLKGDALTDYEVATMFDRCYVPLLGKFVQVAPDPVITQFLQVKGQQVTYRYQGYSMTVTPFVPRADIRCPHGAAIELVNNRDYALPDSVPQPAPTLADLVSFTTESANWLSEYCVGHYPSRLTVESVSPGGNFTEMRHDITDVSVQLTPIADIDLPDLHDWPTDYLHTLNVTGPGTAMQLHVSSLTVQDMLRLLTGNSNAEQFDRGRLRISADDMALRLNCASVQTVYMVMHRNTLTLEYYSQLSTRNTVRLELTDGHLQVLIDELEQSLHRARTFTAKGATA